MDVEHGARCRRLGPTEGGRFLWRGLAITLAAAAVFGPSAAWGVQLAQRHFAPVIIFPLLVEQAHQGRQLNVGGYVVRGWQAWLSWALDGALVLLAAMFLVVPVTRPIGRWTT